MLLDTFRVGSDREALLAVLQRRRRYLQTRANLAAERSALQDPGTGWQATMATASLYLEAAEGAVALGEFDEARPSIRSAAEVFLRLDLPYGAALQLAFAPEDRELRALSEALLSSWTRATRGGELDESGNSTGGGFAERALEAPQQHAYHALSLALAHAHSPDPALGAAIESLRQWPLVPVGRMRTPMIQYKLVLDYCAPSLLKTPRHEDLVNRVVLPVVGELLVALHRAVLLASHNTYLWSRGLAPVPWFDFDAALLVAVVLATQSEVAGDLAQRVRSAVPVLAAQYASEFVVAVQRLRGEEEPLGQIPQHA